MANRCDLDGILTSIKTILDAANTTTASPIDLSSNMAKRVQKVLKVHPLMIKPQASYFPFVTCFVDSKTVDAQKSGLGPNQTHIQRRADLSINVIGTIWNQNMTNNLEDPATEDINYLMENIELVLRSHPNLSTTVFWQFPESIEYFQSQFDQQTHLRSGLLTLKASVFY